MCFKKPLDPPPILGLESRLGGRNASMLFDAAGVWYWLEMLPILTTTSIKNAWCYDAKAKHKE